MKTVFIALAVIVACAYIVPAVIGAVQAIGHTTQAIAVTANQ